MNFSLAVTAVFPIMAFMLIGSLLNRVKLLSAVTLTEMNRFIYYICFPLVMVNSIYRANLSEAFDPAFLAVMILLVLLVAGALIFILPRFFPQKPVLGSMLQGMIRSNSILFSFPVVIAISGIEQTGLISLCIATVVPLYNVLCVIILEVLRGGKLNYPRLFLGIVKNPVIIGTLAGLAVKVSGLVLPAFAEKPIADIAALVTPLALILLGAGLRFTDTMKYRRELAVVIAVKLLLAPLLFVLVVRFMGFGPVAVTTAMAFSAVPTAISSYVQAREMQADGVLAGQIVAVTTVLSMGTLFLWVSILSGIGWIG